MYERSGRVPPGLSGFDLGKFLTNVVGSVVKGTRVTIPTPAGPVTYDLSNPSDVAYLKSIASGSTVKFQAQRGPQQPQGVLEQVNANVQQVPGGWLTIAGIGIGAFFLIRALARR